jgi:mobilization protein NikA
VSHWRRTRMISFRVSEDEFELLKTKSEAEGARNVSEFARLTLCGQSNGGSAAVGHPNTDPTQLTQLRDDLQELGAYVRRVAELIERGRTPVATRSPMLPSVPRTADS